MWRWPWPNDLDIRTWPRYKKSELFTSRLSKVGALQPDRQTDATENITTVHSRMVKIRHNRNSSALSGVITARSASNTHSIYQGLSPDVSRNNATEISSTVQLYIGCCALWSYHNDSTPCTDSASHSGLRLRVAGVVSKPSIQGPAHEAAERTRRSTTVLSRSSSTSTAASSGRQRRPSGRSQWPLRHRLPAVGLRVLRRWSLLLTPKTVFVYVNQI